FLVNVSGALSKKVQIKILIGKSQVDAIGDPRNFASEYDAVVAVDYTVFILVTKHQVSLAHRSAWDFRGAGHLLIGLVESLHFESIKCIPFISFGADGLVEEVSRSDRRVGEAFHFVSVESNVE